MKNITLILWVFAHSVFYAIAQPVTLSGVACGGGAVSGTWTVPCGVTSITVEVYGSGGGAGGGGGGSNGGFFSTRGGGGAGGGAYTSITITVIPGATFTYNIGTSGCGGSGGGDGSSGNNGTNGGNSTFTGADAGGTPINLIANGGIRGTTGSGTGGSPGNGGAGGTASGGTTNLNGVAGNNGSGGNGGAGGAGAGPAGGAGGPNTNNPGSSFGGGGAGGGNSSGGNGGAGGIIVTLNTPVVLPPTPTITSTPPTCTSDGISTISNFDPAATYLFTPTGPTVGPGGVISGMNVGTNYTVIASIGGCDSPPSLAFSNLAAVAIPIPTVSTSPPSCTSDGISVVTNFNAAFTYIFTPTGPTVGASGTISGMAIGTNYTLEASDGSCNSLPSASFVNAAQFPSPVAVISGSLSFCVGGNTTLTASGGTSFAWTDVGGNNIGNSANVTVTQGTFSVTVTDGNGCTDSSSVVVTETTSLVVSIDGDSTICEATNTTLTATGGNLFLWDDANNSTMASITVPAGTYSVTVSDASGCSGTATVNVIETANPSISISGSLGHCPGETTTITANGGVSYIWDDVANSTTQNITVAQGTYTVIGTDALGCTATASATVIENPLPNIVFVGDSTICEGGTTTITATGAASYTWSPVTGLSNTNIPDPTISLLSDTQFTVTGTDTNGCINTAQITVRIAPAPEAMFDFETNCAGLPITFTNTSTPTGLNFNWNFGNNTTSTLENPIETFSQSGDFLVTLIADNGECADTFSANVNVLTQPIASFSGTPLSVVVNEEAVIFSNSSVGGELWFWDFGDSTSINTTFDPQHTFSKPGLFTVTLIASTLEGCSDTLALTEYVEVIDKPLLFIPNAFSPNGDNINDLFQVLGGGTREFYMTIHDRWGGQVFESEDINIAWDGTFKGDRLSTGVYVYYIKAAFNDLTIRTFKGSILLFEK